ncbi:ATP-binding cassette domain-containing protein [Polaribacter litorisediminis]|uniref:ABC transporter ATP-binding protein n=1 Tax=Polaribacter litorisediminis TaxID=1908341 RepID=UPI001CC14F8C|nr:ATP-binding cassette domain-containing protein [Polaribacter litorisediminis]UAM98179.1 ATP-binding cassette domain-containing protein [Polaribacter litorisediminis]
MNKYIIEAQKLDFSYSKSSKDIKKLNLQVPKGSIYGFLGSNGSGKSTTIRLLLGLLKKDSGTISLFGNSFKENRIENLSKIGALIENPSLYEHLNALDNLKIAANYKSIHKSRIDEVLEIVKLTHAKHKKVKKYSLGMKQRLGIAIALLSEPEILILDEPTNGLDPKGIIEMRSLIKSLNKDYGTTIFISSHLLSEIEKTCSHVGIINDGKMLFQNTVKALKESQSDDIVINIESNDSEHLKHVISPLSIHSEILNMSFINITIKNKKDIPFLIDKIRKAGIEIYQINIKNNLEDLFLTLTEK